MPRSKMRLERHPAYPASIRSARPGSVAPVARTLNRKSTRARAGVFDFADHSLNDLEAHIETMTRDLGQKEEELRQLRTLPQRPPGMLDVYVTATLAFITHHALRGDKRGSPARVADEHEAAPASSSTPPSLRLDDQATRAIQGAAALVGLLGASGALADRRVLATMAAVAFGAALRSALAPPPSVTKEHVVRTTLLVAETQLLRCEAEALRSRIAERREAIQRLRRCL